MAKKKGNKKVSTKPREVELPAGLRYVLESAAEEVEMKSGRPTEITVRQLVDGGAVEETLCSFDERRGRFVVKVTDKDYSGLAGEYDSLGAIDTRIDELLHEDLKARGYEVRPYPQKARPDMYSAGYWTWKCKKCGTWGADLKEGCLNVVGAYQLCQNCGISPPTPLEAGKWAWLKVNDKYVYSSTGGTLCSIDVVATITVPMLGKKKR